MGEVLATPEELAMHLASRATFVKNSPDSAAGDGVAVEADDLDLFLRRLRAAEDATSPRPTGGAHVRSS